MAHTMPLSKESISPLWVFSYEVVSNKIKNAFGLSQLVKILRVYFVSARRPST